ncbi:MAG: AMP-binding protein [Slackia sp.]
MSSETMREVMDRMYMKEITICYGLTETSPVFYADVADDDIVHKCETVGLKHPPVSVRVIDGRRPYLRSERAGRAVLQGITL